MSPPSAIDPPAGTDPLQVATPEPASAHDESFSQPLLEYPQYTRPREFRGEAVPEVLLSGDHAKIAQWRRRQALLRTRERRPDLLAQAEVMAEDAVWLAGRG